MAAQTARLDLPTVAGVTAASRPRTTLRPLRRRAHPTTLLLTCGTDLLSLDLATRATTTLASGLTAPTAVTLDASGRTAYVIDQESATTYAVLAVPVTRRRRPKRVHDGTGTPTAIALRGSTLALVDAATGELRTLDLATDTESTIGTGLGDVGGLGYGDDGRLHLTQTSTGRWLAITAGDPGFTEVATALGSPRNLTDARRAKTLLVTGHDGTRGTLDALRLTTGAVTRLADLGPGPSPTVDPEHAPFAAWSLAADLVVAVDARGVSWWDPTQPDPVVVPALPVTLTLEDPNPFIGTYQRVRVDLGTTGLALTDLDLRCEDEVRGGQVSLSRDDLSAPDEVMLLVGDGTGRHTLVATERATGTIVGQADFDITAEWTDAGASPGHWCTGPVGEFQTGSTWGGGPLTPQNVDVQPQSGARGVALVMVDVSDARYPTGAAYTTIRDAWRESLVGTNSARRYFEELARGTFTLALRGSAIPLVHLGGDWASQFTAMDPPWSANSFAPTASLAFAQAIISDAAGQRDAANNPIIDFAQVRSVIFVVRSAGPAGTDNFFWPQAWGGNFTIPGGSVNLDVLGMPDDWEGVRDGRTRTMTLCHELGHNLGFPDLYTNVPSWNYSPDIQSRDVSSFDLMSSEGQLPGLTIAQRMEVGWVRPEWVRTFDFSRSTVPLSQTVTLSAVEAGMPPAGQLAGVEIRIADGWNYYFEYRRSQAGQLGDQLLGSDANTGNGVVVGTDVTSRTFSFPINRPQVIRLRPDVEGERSFFASGQDYKERDTSSMAVADFRMSVVSTSGNTATVKIEYGTNGRPDLSIRPWPGGNDWQSPDVEVRNARSLADPARWANVPWEGHANTVVARYRNRGPVTCRGVQVDFFIKDFTVGGAPEVFLGSDTRDVPPESTTPFVEFTTQWLPGNQGHRCIIARTPLYVDTSVTPNVVELTDTNNMAQTNYTRYISASASPARRVRTWVAVHNPWSQRALMYVLPQIHGPFAQFYRLYLEHQAVVLDPGETRRVEVMAESMYGDPRFGAAFERISEKFFREPARASLVGYGVPPDAPSHPVLLGGATIAVDSARGTQFTSLDVSGAVVVRGRVATVDGDVGCPGSVLVTFHPEDPAKESERNTISVPLRQDGEFVAEIAPYVEKFRAKTLSLHYPGRPGYAACDPKLDRFPLG